MFASQKKSEFELFTEMKTAIIDNENLFIANRVKGYSLEDGALCEVDRKTDWMLGGGDMVGTIDDVYRLNQAIKKRFFTL